MPIYFWALSGPFSKQRLRHAPCTVNVPVYEARFGRTRHIGNGARLTPSHIRARTGRTDAHERLNPEMGKSAERKEKED